MLLIEIPRGIAIILGIVSVYCYICYQYYTKTKNFTPVSSMGYLSGNEGDIDESNNEQIKRRRVLAFEKMMKEDGQETKLEIPIVQTYNLKNLKKQHRKNAKILQKSKLFEIEKRRIAEYTAIQQEVAQRQEEIENRIKIEKQILHNPLSLQTLSKIAYDAKQLRHENTIVDDVQRKMKQKRNYFRKISKKADKLNKRLISIHEYTQHPDLFEEIDNKIYNFSNGTSYKVLDFPDLLERALDRKNDELYIIARKKEKHRSSVFCVAGECLLAFLFIIVAFLSQRKTSALHLHYSGNRITDHTPMKKKNMFMNIIFSDDDSKQIDGGIYHIGMELIGRWQKHMGYGFFWKGNFFTAHHVTEGEVIHLRDKIFKPWKINEGDDFVAYGSKDIELEPIIEDNLFVYTADPWGNMLLETTKVTQDGRIINHNIIPGNSGLPIVQETDHGYVPVAVISAYCPKTSEATFSTCSSIGEKQQLAGTRVTWIIAGCGSGKTRTTIPNLVEKYQKQQIFIAGPNRVVANELNIALKDKYPVEACFSTATGIKKKSNIKLFCHATLCRVLQKQRRIDPGIYIIDEAHMALPETIALLKILSYAAAKDRQVQVFLLSATSPTVIEKSTNWPVKRIKSTEEQAIQAIMANKDKKWLWIGIGSDWTPNIPDYHEKVIKLSRKNIMNLEEAKKLDKGLIVATDIVECGANLNVTHLVDSCKKNQPIFDRDLMEVDLKILPTTQASSTQRIGRVGRTTEGTAYLLGNSGNNMMYHEEATYWLTAYMLVNDATVWNYYKLPDEPNDLQIILPQNEIQKWNTSKQNTNLEPFIDYFYQFSATYEQQEKIREKFIKCSTFTNYPLLIESAYEMALIIIPVIFTSIIAVNLCFRRVEDLLKMTALIRPMYPLFGFLIIQIVPIQKFIAANFFNTFFIWMILANLLQGWFPKAYLTQDPSVIGSALLSFVYVGLATYKQFGREINIAIDYTYTYSTNDKWVTTYPFLLMTLTQFIGQAIIAKNMIGSYHFGNEDIRTFTRVIATLFHISHMLRLDTQINTLIAIFGVIATVTFIYSKQGAEAAIAMKVDNNERRNINDQVNFNLAGRANMVMGIIFTYYCLGSMAGNAACQFDLLICISIYLLGYYMAMQQYLRGDLVFAILLLIREQALAAIILSIGIIFNERAGLAQNFYTTELKNHWTRWKTKLNQMNQTEYRIYKNKDVITIHPDLKKTQINRSYFKIEDIAPHIGKRILELGTGKGGWCSWILSLQYKFEKYDTITLHTNDRVIPDKNLVYKAKQKHVNFHNCDAHRFDYHSDYDTFLSDIGESRTLISEQEKYSDHLRNLYDKVFLKNPQIENVLLKEMAPWSQNAIYFAKRWNLTMIRSTFARNTSSEVYYVKGKIDEEKVNDIARTLLKRMNLQTARLKDIEMNKPERNKTYQYKNVENDVLFKINHEEALSKFQERYTITQPEINMNSMIDIGTVNNLGNLSSGNLKNRIIDKFTRKLRRESPRACCYALTDVSAYGVWEVFDRKIDNIPTETHPHREKENEVIADIKTTLKQKDLQIIKFSIHEAIDRLKNKASPGLHHKADWKEDPDLFWNVVKEIENIKNNVSQFSIVNTMGKREKKLMKQNQRIGSRQIAYYDIVFRIIEQMYLGDLMDKLPKRKIFPEAVGGMNPVDYFETFKEDIESNGSNIDSQFYLNDDIAGWDTRIGKTDLINEYKILDSLIEDEEQKLMVKWLYSHYADHILFTKRARDDGSICGTLFHECKGRLSGVIITYGMNTITNIIKNRVHIMDTFKVSAINARKMIESNRLTYMISGDDKVVAGNPSDIQKLAKNYQYWKEIGFPRKEIKDDEDSKIITDFKEIEFCSHSPIKITFNTDKIYQKWVADRDEGDLLGKMYLSVGAFSQVENEIAHALCIRNCLLSYYFKRDIRILIGYLTAALPINIIPMGKSFKPHIIERYWMTDLDVISCANAIFSKSSAYPVGTITDLNQIGFCTPTEDLERGSLINTPQRALWKKQLPTVVKNFHNEFNNCNYLYNPKPEAFDFIEVDKIFSTKILPGKKLLNNISKAIGNFVLINHGLVKTTLDTEDRNLCFQNGRIVRTESNDPKVYITEDPRVCNARAEYHKAIENNCEYFLTTNGELERRMIIDTKTPYSVTSNFFIRHFTERFYLYQIE